MAGVDSLIPPPPHPPSLFPFPHNIFIFKSFHHPPSSSFLLPATLLPFSPIFSKQIISLLCSFWIVMFIYYLYTVSVLGKRGEKRIIKKKHSGRVKRPAYTDTCRSDQFNVATCNLRERGWRWGGIEIQSRCWFVIYSSGTGIAYSMMERQGAYISGINLSDALYRDADPFENG